jgi:hypothetical protein
LQISKNATHGAGKTHFTIFPEYSMPGLDGVAVVEDALHDQSWPTGSIVIGGTDALSQTEYAILTGGRFTSVDGQRNGPEQVPTNNWINCGIVWVKSADNHIERWIQPKLAPAWPEQNIQHRLMFRGGSIYLFNCRFDNGTPCLFFVLICFDWIARDETHTIWQRVLETQNERTRQIKAELPLSWVFVIQHNEKPCHPDFLSGAADFFNNTAYCPLVRRERACVIFANTAGKREPGRIASYGFSSLIFSPLAPFSDAECQPTFSSQGKRLRGNELLGRCRDILFREGGACVHSFSQYVPHVIGLSSGSRTLPLERAYIYPITGALGTPRSPHQEVPASVKWFNDVLDGVECLSARYSTVPLANSVKPPHAANIEEMRPIDSLQIQRRIDLATSNSQAKHADDWDEPENLALNHIIHTLDILRLSFTNIDIPGSQVHATLTIRGQPVEVLSIVGNSHEQCLKHSEKFVPTPRHQVILVSRDRDNTPWFNRLGNFLSPENSRLGEESKFTDVRSAFVQVGYQDLLNAYRSARTLMDLEGSLYGRFTT